MGGGILRMEEDYRTALMNSPPPPHVLFFPLPFQGPVNCMLKLAEIFCLNGFRVTFLNTEYVHRRLVSYSDLGRRFERYPNLRFATVADGLPEDNPRTGDQLLVLLNSMEAVSKPVFKEIVNSGSRDDEFPLTCIIVDGAFFYAADIAQEIGIPLLFFDTISPCSLWTLLSLPNMIKAGDFPFPGILSLFYFIYFIWKSSSLFFPPLSQPKNNGYCCADDNLDASVKSVPGMEGVLRRRDLPSFYRAKHIDDPIIQAVLKEGPEIIRARGLIFNTFENLEGPILSQMATLGPEVYAIGPVHTQLKIRLQAADQQQPEILSNSIWKENRSCISWLDLQPPRSVLYFSIGSMAVMTREQLIEIWYGLVGSGVRFLWVRRAGSVTKLYEEDSEIPAELSEGTMERGCIVSWAPQEEVLGHPAVGGFLTHSGWNSTLESIVEGVPMICWPYYADQQVNSRYIGKVWKLGLDMKDTCDRAIVEMMVRDLMVLRNKEFLKRAEEMAVLAELSVCKGGSSYNNMNRLIQDIKFMSLEPRKKGAVQPFI